MVMRRSPRQEKGCKSSILRRVDVQKLTGLGEGKKNTYQWYGPSSRNSRERSRGPWRRAISCPSPFSNQSTGGAVDDGIRMEQMQRLDGGVEGVWRRCLQSQAVVDEGGFDGDGGGGGGGLSGIFHKRESTGAGGAAAEEPVPAAVPAAAPTPVADTTSRRFPPAATTAAFSLWMTQRRTCHGINRKNTDHLVSIVRPGRVLGCLASGRWLRQGGQN